MPATDPTRDWTPRRKGAVYCSPACGGGCTHAAHRAASRAAAALAARLGHGWKPRVWENLGWYYAAEVPTPKGWAGFDGRLEVHPVLTGGGKGKPARFVRYDAYLGSYVGSGRAPEEAVLAAVHDARRDLSGLARLIAQADAGLHAALPDDLMRAVIALLPPPARRSK